MNNIMQSLIQCESEGKTEFRYKLNPSIKAIEVFKELKSKNYNPELEECDNDLYIVVKLKTTKVINLVDYQPKKRIISIDENVIQVAFGRVNG
jgi:hypothetical protein